jgi:hypothetical protein
MSNLTQNISSLLIIDPSINNYQQLVDGTDSSTSMMVLDPTQDGVEQITTALRFYSAVQQIHLICHGAPGVIYLGNGELSLSNCDRYSQQLKTWSPSQLFLYGCNVAAGDAGAEFLEKLYRLTGSAIAASTHLVGHQTLGGSWDLDQSIGEISAESIIVAATQESYVGTFPASFGTPTNTASGGNFPRGLATGDIDNDGDVDLVIANETGNNVSLLKNNGNGTFATATTFSTGGNSPHPIALADFNSDGRLDVVAPNFSGSNVGLLINNGAGGFNPATAVSVGPSPVYAIAADFNKDGRADVVTANLSGSVSILINNGAGGFNPANNINVGSNTYALASGDFNRDGNLDLVAVNNNTSAGNVKILTGNGAGGFTPTNITVSGSPLGVTAGDFDDDGQLDLAIAATSNLFVLLNTGNGTFGAPSQFALGTNIFAVTSGDLNRDGRLDIAAVDRSNNTVRILENNGSGSFTLNGTTYTVGSSPSGIVAVDLNNDGRLDLATSNASSSNFSVLLNTTTNNAPVLNVAASPTLGTVNVGVATPTGLVGTLVSDLVDLNPPVAGLNNVTDADSVVTGIAITAADTSQGTWWYSINEGLSWQTLSAVSETNARLLAANGATRLYFQATSGPGGTIANAMTFRAWDRSSGVNGEVANVTTNGGATSFSTATDTISITVNVPNATPTNLGISASTIDENVSTGAPIGTLTSTDPDAGNTFTYSLVTGTGDTDNAAFTIVGNQLQINASPDFETKSSYSVRVRTTDQGGLSFEKPLTITVNNVNETPTDLGISSSAIAENVAPNSVVGNLSSIDPDSGNTFTYSLVTGSGDTDNAAFTIVGNQLQINASPDFETKSNYNVRVQTTDQNGLSFEKPMTITVNDLPENGSPTNISLSSSAIDENSAIASNIGTLTSTDPNVGDTFTYSLVTGTGDTDNSTFTIVGSQLQINASPDFETKSSYSVRVRTTDQNGLSFEKPMTITVNNVNETPTDLGISSSAIAENVAPNSVVGNLSSIDPDSGNTFTYSLVTGAGDTDNAAFTIVGNQLQINASPDFETKSNYSVRVRTTDQNALSFEKPMTIGITDLPENGSPTNISLSSSAIDENSAIASNIGTLTSTDPNVGDTFTYTLIAGSGDTDNSAFLIVGDQLKINASTNFEAKPNLSIRVRSQDQNGLSFEKVLAVTVNNVNEMPTDLSLSSTQIAENVPANTVVGTFATTDPDTGNTFTYTLVTGTGDTDNAGFTIEGSQLKINASPDFEAKPSYNIRVRTTDQNGLTFEKPVTVSVQDVAESFSDFVGTQASSGLGIALDQLSSLFKNQLLDANVPIVGKLSANGTIPDFLTTLRTSLVNAVNGAGANISANAMETLLNSTLASSFPGARVVRSSNLAETSFEVTLNQQSTVTKIAQDLGMPGLGLRVDSGNGNGTLNSELKLVFGSNQSHGFFIDSDRTKLTSNLDFGLGANFNGSGKMGLFKVNLQDDATGMTRARAEFAGKLNDVDPNNTGSATNRLTASELDTNKTNAALKSMQLTSSPNIGIKIKTDMGAAAIPGVNATLTGNIPILNYVNGAWAGGELSRFGFKNTELSLGSLANNIVLPALKRVDSVMAPIRPVLDVLYQDLKPIGIGYVFPDIDGDGKSTLVDMAEAKGGSLVKFVSVIKTVSDLSKTASASSNTGLLLGDFSLANKDANDQIINVFAAPNTLRNAVITQTSSPLGINNQLNSDKDDIKLIQSFKRLEGVKFNLFDDSTNAVRLLMGQPVNLFTYDAPEVELNFSVSKTKNLGKTPFVVGVAGTVFASADLAFGYDTFGLQQWADTNYASNSIGNVFNGFYISDRKNADGTGEDVSEFKVGLGLEVIGGLGLAVKPIELFGGLKGGLVGGPTFDLNDPNNDGKVRAGELVSQFPLNFSGVAVDASIGAEVSASNGGSRKVGKNGKTEIDGGVSIKLLDIIFWEGSVFKYDAKTQKTEFFGVPADDLIRRVNNLIPKITSAARDFALKAGQIALEATKKAATVVYKAGAQAVDTLVQESKAAYNTAVRTADKVVSLYNEGKAAEDKLRKKGIKSLTPKEIAAIGVSRGFNNVKQPIVQVKNFASNIGIKAQATITKAVSAPAKTVTRTVTNTVSNTVTRVTRQAEPVKKKVVSFARKLFNQDIAEALVFFDANFNGILDENEPFAITESDGSFDIAIDMDVFDTNQNEILDDSEGQQVAMGGYGAYNGLASEVTFVAPGASFAINPLTTLISQMMQDGKSQEEASELVAQSLGLPAELDVSSFLPELELNGENAALGAKYEALLSQVTVTVQQLTKLLDGASNLSSQQIQQSVLKAITEQLATGAPVDLSNTTDVQKVLTTAITSVKAADPTVKSETLVAIASQIATVVAEANQNISKAAQAAPADVLRQIGLVQRVALGDTSDALEAVGAGKKSVGSLVAENTGSGFEKLLAAAKKEMKDGSARGDILRGSKQADVLSGQAGDDIIFGDLGDDKLFGNTDDDQLQGQEGNDLLDGSLGNDLLEGDFGRDRLIGGDGNDTLIGGVDRDTLVGGKGRDRFSLSIGQKGLDRIADFSTRDDVLVINGLSVIEGLTPGRALNKKFFKVGNKAGDRNDFLVYNKKTGGLFVDGNGSVKGLQTKIAQLTPGLSLTASDIIVG